MQTKIPAYGDIAYYSLYAIYITSLFWTPCTAYSTKQTEVVKHTISDDPSADGFWKSNVQWKSRWVKYWRPKAIYVPIWKKVWSPVVQNEWVPLPKVPPGWEVRKDGVIDSTNSDWSKNSIDDEIENSSSSTSNRAVRSPKSYNGWRRMSSSSMSSGRSSSSSGGSYDSVYSSHGDGGVWKKGLRRTIVREIK